MVAPEMRTHYFNIDFCIYRILCKFSIKATLTDGYVVCVLALPGRAAAAASRAALAAAVLLVSNGLVVLVEGAAADALHGV